MRGADGDPAGEGVVRVGRPKLTKDTKQLMKGQPNPPELLILSEHSAGLYEPAGREVCVSVTDPGKLPALLSDRFLAVLRLAFTDIDQSPGDSWEVLFTADHAKEIVHFIQRWSDVDRVVIHCRAGLSRSPGIAMGLCDVFSWPLGDMESEHPLCNRWVRRELARIGREVTQRE